MFWLPCVRWARASTECRVAWRQRVQSSPRLGNREVEKDVNPGWRRMIDGKEKERRPET